MILWSIQKQEAWYDLEKKGVYQASSTFVIDNRIFAPEVPLEEDTSMIAYKWLSQKMEEKIGKPPIGVQYPVWCWYWYMGKKHAKPDLRSAGHRGKGEKAVLIEFEIEDSKALLSDFIMWHFPLGGHFLPTSRKAESIYNGLIKIEGPNGGRIPGYLMHLKQKSWEAIFDLNCRCSSLTHKKNDKCIQATVWEIPLKNVKKHTFFTCR